MAYYKSPKPEDTQEGVPAAAPATSIVSKPGSSTIDSGASGGQPGGTPSIPVAQAQRPTFAKLSDYVRANKEQTAKLAGDVGNVVTGAGTQARDALKTGTNQFNQAVDKNTVTVDEDVFNRAKEDPTAFTAGVNPNADLSGLKDRAAPQNTFNLPAGGRQNRMIEDRNLPGNQFTGNVEAPEGIQDKLKQSADLGTFLNMRDAEYKGPTSLETSEFYKPIEEKFNTANQATENAKTEQGNRELLSDIQKKQTGNVNQSALSLNNALLRTDSNARDILGTAAGKNADLADTLKAEQGRATNRVDNATTTTDRTKQAVANAFGGQRGEIEKTLEDRAQGRIGEANAQTQQIQDALANGETPYGLLDDLGMTPKQWIDLTDSYNKYKKENGSIPFDLAGYLSTTDPAQNINAQNVASKDEYAKYQALNTLMGTKNDFLSDPSLAGTASNDAVDFNYDQAVADINQLNYNKVKAEEDHRAEVEQMKKDVKKRLEKKMGPLAPIFKKFKLF